MEKDKIKGKMKDVSGRAQRQLGEWTGDEESQAKGAGKQIEGKAQNIWGKVKETGRDVASDIERSDDREVIESEREVKVKKRPRKAA